MIQNKLFPWQLAQWRKKIVNFVTIPLVVSKTYFDTWASVFRTKD